MVNKVKVTVSFVLKINEKVKIVSKSSLIFFKFLYFWDPLES